MKRLDLANAVLCLIFLTTISAFTGCSREKTPVEIQKAIPDIPTDTAFGDLYPHITSLLSAEHRDTLSATRDTRTWAEQNLSIFPQASCATLDVLWDSDFTQIFGSTTLGVTLPWMQIYIRDGKRYNDTFFWTDPSLFVSTILHEHVHALQRAEQSSNGLQEGASCDTAKYALERREYLWSAGFRSLRASRNFASSHAGFSNSEVALLYQWTSPIIRARDEVHASAQTLRWMKEKEQQLNPYTMGGLNNWVYGIQYLERLRDLAASDCFSPDDQTYDWELRVYTQELEKLIEVYEENIDGMRELLAQHRVHIQDVDFNTFQIRPTPLGRHGLLCEEATRAPAPPSFRAANRDNVSVQLVPFQID